MPVPAPAPVPDGSTGPATTIPGAAGMEAQAPLWVDSALNFLRKAARVEDAKSDRAKALRKAMEELAKVYGVPSPDLTKASLKMAEETMPAVGPTNPAAFADMMRQVGANRAGQPAPALAPQTPATAGA